MSDGGTAVRALVVEDDEGNRLLLSRFLTQEGFEVEAVADGPAAVQAVTADPPDVVVLDLGLPGLDGIEVLRRIRRDSGVPVLVLTGRDDEPAKLAGFEVGADDYVVKPFSLPEISARLARARPARHRRRRRRSASSSTGSSSTSAPRSRRSTASRSTSGRRSSRCSRSWRRRPGAASPARSCSSTSGARPRAGSRRRP